MTDIHAPSASDQDRLLKARLLEQLTIEAWPPVVREPLDGWMLRASAGVSRRGNSVWTAAPFPVLGAEDNDWLERAEAFAARHGISSCFYVSETSPDGLDTLLDAAGYRLAEPCYLMAGSAELALRLMSERPTNAANAEMRIHLPEAEDRQVNAAWMQDFLAFKKMSAEQGEAYAAIFGGIAAQHTFARISIAGETAALATAVAQGRYAYVSNLMVAPQFRRRGLAASMMTKLIRWAADRGAEELYFQVLQDNRPAIALYEQLGFEIVARHHYRVR
ncbi:hypothetical protein CDO73_22950 [Saccharibacillus sp. O23]|uniref:GNAT family N-acetyltransferase n=1 Tax=Saccharibacillus sp. O23 TaxID=2009338 RepID=UPI000B4E6FDD|nr:GNAT family N-acetyltransferase [Saccharibacillus sp. O23]OWR27113.1 hypothetical protein CDO73_22950 [Saccharibacillus sp. O23]